jgi:hypothetical protein
LQCHELTHLKLESEARRAGKNLFFATTARTRETAIRSVAGDIRKWEKAGYPEEKITEITLALTRGLCEFLFNCPLDMVIERHLHAAFPPLRPAQFLSVGKMAAEAWQTNSNPEIRRLTPRKIFLASLALNGAYGLFLDDLFGGASALAAPYRRLENFALSEKLWQHWQAHARNLGPGDEYGLVDDFADMTGLRDWYEWKPDPGDQPPTADEPVLEGTTNPELLRAKHPAAVWFLLDALQRYARLPSDEVRKIAFEIGMLGREGLDYADPEKKYRLRTLPGESFSGLQLMCLMHAGFKRLAPEQDTGMDLDAPFLTALEMFNLGKNKEMP